MSRLITSLAVFLLAMALAMPVFAGDWRPLDKPGQKVEIVNKRTGERREVGKDWDQKSKKKREKDAADEANKEDKAARKAKKKKDKEAETAD
jgi:hypothetical protein